MQSKTEADYVKWVRDTIERSVALLTEKIRKLEKRLKELEEKKV